MNTPDESCLFPIQRSLKDKLGDFEVTFLVFINIAVSEIRIYNNFFFYFNSNIHEYNFGFVPTPLFFMEVSLKVRHFGLCGMNYNLYAKLYY